jgi:hypothetical protein
MSSHKENRELVADMRQRRDIYSAAGALKNRIKAMPPLEFMSKFTSMEEYLEAERWLLGVSRMPTTSDIRRIVELVEERLGPE